MRVLVVEWASSGLGGSGPEVTALRHEGREMLRSIVEDFSAIQEVSQVLTPVEPALGAALRALSPKIVPCATRLAAVRSAKTWLAGLVRSSDAALIVAPELGGTLEKLSRAVLRSGGRLLGCAPDGIALASDKARTAGRLLRAGVPTCPTRRFDPVEPGTDGVRFPAVLKPRRGAGAVWTYLVRDRRSLETALERARRDGAPEEWSLSEFVPGVPASASFLVGPSRSWALTPGWQQIHLDARGRFHYRGSRLPLAPPGLATRATRLARRAVEALPGLGGFVGVDLVLGDASDASGDRVVEINPRPTTSYVELRRLEGGTGIARRWLRLASASADSGTLHACRSPAVQPLDTGRAIDTEPAP